MLNDSANFIRSQSFLKTRCPICGPTFYITTYTDVLTTTSIAYIGWIKCVLLPAGCPYEDVIQRKKAVRPAQDTNTFYLFHGTLWKGGDRRDLYVSTSTSPPQVNLIRPQPAYNPFPPLTHPIPIATHRKPFPVPAPLRKVQVRFGTIKNACKDRHNTRRRLWNFH